MDRDRPGLQTLSSIRPQLVIGSLLAVFLIAFSSMPALTQDGFSLDGIFENLNKDEEQLVTDTLKEQLPSMALSDEDRAFAEGLVEDGKNIARFSKEISEGDYSGVGKALANATAEQLQKQIEARFPDPDSPMRQMLGSVQNNTDTYKKLAKAALNTDPDLARTAIEDALKEHAEKHVGDLLNQGKDFWKGLIRDVIPGSEQMGKYGVDPVDIYLQGVEDWTDFVKRAKRGQEIFVFDCLHRRYRKVLAETNEPGTARDAVERLGLRGFDCVATRAADMPDIAREPADNAFDATMRGISDAVRGARDAGRRITTDTSTLADFGLDRRDVIELIEEFEQLVRNGTLSRTQANGGFHDWLRNRIMDNVRTRTTRVRDPVVKQQEKATSDQAETLRRVVEVLQNILPEVLRTALGNDRLTELSGLPIADHLPEDEVQTFAEGRKQEEEQKKKDKKKRQEQAAKEAEKELECNPEYQPKAKNGGLDDGFIPQETAAEGPNYVDKEGCRPFGPVVAKRFQYEVPDDVSPARKKKNEATKQCDGLNVRLAQASQHYASGEIKLARGVLTDVSIALAKLPDHTKCPDVRERLTSNLDKVTRITTVLGKITEALTACEPNRLDAQANLLRNAQNKKLKTMRTRIALAKPVAEYYTRAKKAYITGEIGRSRYLFQDALTRAERAEQETCHNIQDRIGNNLRRIAKLQEFDNATVTAVENCNMPRITRLMKGLAGTTNPFLDKAYDRLSNVPEKCQRHLANAACQKSFGAYAVASDVKKNEDGGYSCQCRSGYQWKPQPDGGASNSCITTAEANTLNRQARNDNCRKKFGSGYYAGTPDKKGSYYCRPTKAAANSWCNRNNKGSGWYAGKIGYKGGFNCYSRGRAKSKRRARTRTRGRRVVRKPRYRKPKYDPQAAAAAAAAAGVILQGIQAYNRSKRRRRGGGGGGCSNPRAPGC